MNAAPTARPDARPLIAHLLFRLDYGGMENGLVNLVNTLPRAEFRHAIITLSGATDFSRRIRREDVLLYSLDKRPGKDPGAYLRLYRLLRELRPALVHTRNIGTLDCTFVAWLAGVHLRVHGEHGWDVHDPDGTRRRYRTLRRALNPLVQRFIAVSRDLERWLTESVGVPAHKVVRICNGVDTERFSAAARATPPEWPVDRFPKGCVIVGSVTRFSEIKDPLNLVRAFLEVRNRFAGAGPDVRLLMIGDGALRSSAAELLAAAGQSHAAWLTGSRNDVAEFLPCFDIFVLGSRREGISNTVLEAMASGVPVIASAVGGNLELIVPGTTGALVPAGDPAALAEAIAGYARDAGMRAAHGAAARERAVREYSLPRMVEAYASLYRELCGAGAPQVEVAA
ncbi:MAG TPA: TIGR03088 family PEP-CTERM/XrtA system glycosyltransferase [Steroidobacteraceae bacterium]